MVTTNDGIGGIWRLSTERICALLMITVSVAAYGHSVGPLGGQPLDWNTEQISGVVAGGSPAYFPSHTAKIEGKKCLVGNLFNVNVRDEYAFDIDETVEMDLDFHRPVPGLKIHVDYDAAGAAYDSNNGDVNAIADSSRAETISLPTGNPLTKYTAHFILRRARFANRGFSGSDLRIYAERPAEPSASSHVEPLLVTICSH